jgi:hypothetical protein
MNRTKRMRDRPRGVASGQPRLTGLQVRRASLGCALATPRALRAERRLETTRHHSNRAGDLRMHWPGISHLWHSVNGRAWGRRPMWRWRSRAIGI